MSNAIAPESLLTPSCVACNGSGRLACRTGCADGACFCDRGPSCDACSGLGFTFAVCVECGLHAGDLEPNVFGELFCGECAGRFHAAVDGIRAGIADALSRTVPCGAPDVDDAPVDTTDWWARQSMTPAACEIAS